MVLENISIKELQKLIYESGANWTAGETSISQLPTNELLRHFGAILPGGDEERKERERISHANFKAWESLPSAGRDVLNAVDWRDYTEPIKYQGKCSACVSFAVIAASEALYRIQWNQAEYDVDYSEADLFFCNGGNCDTGQNVNIALNAFMNKGVVDEDCFKYKAKNIECNQCKNHDWRWTKIRSFCAHMSGIQEIQEHLQNVGPVITIFSVYEDFIRYTGGIYKYVKGNLMQTHAVSIVGYNNDDQCWICKNSWGKKFGEKGYFRIAYGQCGIDSKVWSIADVGMSARLPNMKCWGLLGVTRANGEDIEYGGAHFENDIGWRTIKNDKDVDLRLLSVLIAFKSTNRKMNVSIENGEIDGIENASVDETEHPGSSGILYEDELILHSCMAEISILSIAPPQKETTMAETTFDSETWYNGTITSIKATKTDYCISIKIHKSKETVEKPLYGGSESSITVLTMLAGHALRDKRRIDAREIDGKIDAMYVWSCE